MTLFKIVPIFFSVFFLFSCSPLKDIGEERAAKPEIYAKKLQHKWVLYKIDEQPLSTRIMSTLNISTTNKATGFFACNYFVGMIDRQQDKLKINNMASTKKSCRAERGEVETIVSTVLSDYSQMSLVENQLGLIGKSHRLLYKYQQQ